MKSIQIRLLIAALAVCLGTALAQSQTENAPPPPPPHGHGFGMEGEPLHFWAKQLNLTDDQKAQMKAVMQKEHSTMKPLFEQQHQLDLQLRQYAEGNYDAAKVQILARQKSKVQAQLTANETRIHNELYQLLTSDQQTQLKQMEAEHEARIQQHMQQHEQSPDEN